MTPHQLNFPAAHGPDREQFISPSALTAFSTAEANRDRFKIIYSDLKDSNSLPFTNKDEVFPKSAKNAELSSNLRLNGNKTFAVSNEGALIWYTKSIAAAPYPASEGDNSEELSLAFANRSAVYAKMEKHEAALKDITQALVFQYPDNLKLKLFERQAECYQALGKLKEAAKSWQEAIDVLPLAKTPPADKLSSLTTAIEKLKVKINAPRRKPPAPVGYKLLLPKKAFGQHKEIPCASNCLEIQYSPEFGRHIVSTRDINPGDILMIEDPFASILLPEFYYKCCYNCLNRCDAMVPCTRCSMAMFCSDDCRKKSWDRYHHIECLLMGPLRSLDIFHDILIALRILIIATSTSMYGSLPNLWEKVCSFKENNEDKARTGFNEMGQYSSSDYMATHFLEPNQRKGVLTFAMVASIIVNCLDTFSEFFAPVDTEPLSPTSPSPDNDMNWHVVAGSLLMWYLQMLPPNTYEVKDITYDRMVNELRGSPSGHGIYNTSSLLNHSCCNNTSYFFYGGDKHVLFASQPIKKGEQLFTNYGCHYVTKPLSDRRLYLEPYGFVCQCQACIENWPSAVQLTLHFRLPSVPCARCKTVLPGTLNIPAVKCPSCGVSVNMKMLMQKCVKIQQRLATIKDMMFTPKGLKQDFTKELSKLVTEVFETYHRPSLLAILLQNGLNQNMLRYVNYYTPPQ